MFKWFWTIFSLGAPDDYDKGGLTIVSVNFVVVGRQVKREISSFPVPVRVSKTCLLKLLNRKIFGVGPYWIIGESFSIQSIQRVP